MGLPKILYFQWSHGHGMESLQKCFGEFTLTRTLVVEWHKAFKLRKNLFFFFSVPVKLNIDRIPLLYGKQA